MLKQRPRLFLLLGISLLILAGNFPSSAQAQPLTDYDWPTYANDPGSSKYADLDQINSGTVQDLEVAWIWNSVDNAAFLERPEFVPSGFKSTPIKIDDTLYVTTPLGHAVALNAKTGEQKWVFNTNTWEHGRPANNGFNHRGASFWQSGDKRRVIMGANNAFLWSLDAETGLPDPDFGDGGKVDLTVGLGREVDRAMYASSAALSIVGDIVILGAVIYDDPMFGRVPKKLTDLPPGHIRGFNLNTGEQEWIFHTIPQAGEYGNETWENGSWKVTGATNVWSLMSADKELGYVYLPVGTPGNDWYGGQRLGANLFGTSIVCLDAATGERVWHFQTTHHELWDYDLASAPNLVDITVDGREIKAIAQVSKQGFIYVLDRITGEPVWPIEERPVPPSNIPGERASPTQPFPTRPAPFEPQGISAETLIDFTPELRAEALELISIYDYGSLYTPPSERGTINMPGWGGGANWTGAAFDPETSMYYIPSISNPIVVQLIKTDPAETEFEYIRSGIRNVPSPQGLPLVKPPYGRISAVNLNTGDYEWVRANAEGIRQTIIDKGISDPGPVGIGTYSPLLVTKSFLFQAITDGVPMLRAMDKKSGETVHEIELPGIPQGAPMSYMIDGKQYIAIASGGGSEAKLITLALP